MDIFAKRLKERAKQLGISNAEAARRVGLDERRYAHYASGRREPDLATLKAISEALGITPNWLLGIVPALEGDSTKGQLIGRFANAASAMSVDQLEICVIQAEAVALSNNRQP
ncbi:MAG: transcriptional regulator [Rhizobiales bacterium PAR1]|nr:MAG: transcriptional regulator [Rhizobiales bacterium PAR1]